MYPLTTFPTTSLLRILKRKAMDALKHPAIFLDFVTSPFSEGEQSSNLHMWGRQLVPNITGFEPIICSVCVDMATVHKLQEELGGEAQ